MASFTPATSILGPWALIPILAVSGMAASPGCGSESIGKGVATAIAEGGTGTGGSGGAGGGTTNGPSASLAIAPDTTGDFGEILIDGAYSSPLTFTVTNSGVGTATSLGSSTSFAPFSFEGGAYPGTGGTCGATLAPSSSCTIAVRFKPASSGMISGSLSLSFSDGSGSHTSTQAVTGTGVGVTAMTVGGFTSYALLSNGKIKSWGRDDEGQTGDGHQYTRPLTPVEVSGITRAVSVSAGLLHVCAALANGQVWCWGGGASGQLGNGGTINSLLPVQVTGITQAVEVSSKYYSTCARLSTGAVQCWGSNASGQLGKDPAASGSCGGFACETTPVTIPGISSAISIAVGGNFNGAHACAVLSGGAVKCWGYNTYAQLGTGSGGANQYAPVAVSGIDGSAAKAVAIAAGGYHSCALLDTGAVRCWGNDGNGQLGDGSTSTGVGPPSQVTGIDGVTLRAISITAGSDQTCAALSNGTARCWGSDANGVLGNGGGSDQSSPVQVSATSVSGIWAGWVNGCLRYSNGTLSCWGDGGEGQLGDNSTTDQSTPATLVTGLTI